MPKNEYAEVMPKDYTSLLSIFDNSFVIITDENGDMVSPTDESLYQYTFTLKDFGNNEYYDKEHDIWLKKETKELPSGLICSHYIDISLYKKMILRYEYDRVTGLKVREKMEEEAIKYIEEALYTGEDFTVCMFDLDHFKQVNDKYLHEAGDAVLYNVSQTIKNGVHHRIVYRKTRHDENRPKDIVGRYGGEEIYVLMKNTPLSQYKRIYARIEGLRRRIENNPVHHIYLKDKQEVVINVTTSIGAVHVSNRMLRKLSETCSSSLELFKLIKDEADKCLYYSKDHNFRLDDGTLVRSELELEETDAIYTTEDSDRNQVTLKKLVL